MPQGKTDIQRSIQRQVENIKNRKSISKRNKKLILDFYEKSRSRVSEKRRLFYLNRLKRISEFVSKDFDKFAKENVEKFVANLDSNKFGYKKGDREKSYSDWSKYCFKVALKKFFQWLKGYDWNSQEYPEEVKWLKLTRKNNNEKLPKILSKKDIQKMVKASPNIRDKALISVLYESGCRIGEFLDIKMEDVNFDEYGATVVVKGKTGSRRIRLISSVPNLSLWMENHPYKEGDASLWTTFTKKNHGESLSYNFVRRKLRDLAKKAGIEKGVNPHNFRHSRATHLANELTESQLCEYFGWQQGSEMPRTYVHMSGRDIDNAILKLHGKLPKGEQEREEELKIKLCPRCEHENPPEAEECNKCRMPLTQKAVMERDKKEKELLKLITPEMIEKMIEKKVEEKIRKRSKNPEIL